MAGSKALHNVFVLRDIHNIKSPAFGAKGDGVDDTTALTNFFSVASNRRNYLPAGTYRAASLLQLAALSNCDIYGDPGGTTIVGNFGYGLILLGALNNVHWRGIKFQNDYVNAVLNGNQGAVYAGNTDIRNSSFIECAFAVPNANAHGLLLIARSGAGDTAVIDGLWIEGNLFEEIGQSACTIMNRGNVAARFENAKRVYFRKNKGKNLGLNGNFGMLLSLDGYGSSFAVEDNEITNPYLIAIENTQWRHGSLSRNRFRTFSRKARAITVADSDATDPCIGLYVVGNTCEDPATFHSYASFMNDSYMAGNFWDFTEAGHGSDAAFLFLDSNRNKVFGDRYRSDDAYALRLQVLGGGTCRGNQLFGIEADTSASAANTAVVNFDNASTTENRVEGRLLKGTGGSKVTWTTSAPYSNVVEDRTDMQPSWTPSFSSWTMGDATVVGELSRAGNIANMNFSVTVGASTTPGGTTVIMPLPTGYTLSSTLQACQIGTARLFDQSTGNFYLLIVEGNAGGSVRFRRADTNALLTITAPVTIAAADVITGSLTFSLAD